jgi:hypothetical protein
MPRISFDATISSDELPKAKFEMSPSGPPPSMGPGARPIVPGSPGSNQGTSEHLESILTQVQEIRSHYSISLDDARSRLNISYDLKDRQRVFSLPFENMPLGPLAQSLLYGGTARRLTSGTFVADIIRGAENMAQRDLTQSEAEAHACHASRRMLYSFAAVMSATTIGVGFAVVGRKTMKFPLRKPKPLERYDNFPNRYLPILKGGYARSMWHITRANVYTLCAFFLISPLYSSMGDNAMMVGLYRDPRSNAVLKEMKENKDPNRAFRINRIGSNVESGSKEQRGQIFAQTAAQREKLESQRGKAQYEDPDPQGYYNDSTDSPPNDYSGGKSYDSSPGDPDSTTDTGMLTDSQMQQREARESSPSSFTGVPSFQKARPRTQQSQDDSSDRGSDSADDFIFDDASPTGGRGFSEDTQPQAPVTKSGMGGAWNRVRRGEQTASASKTETASSPPSRRSESTQSSADSFSFSKSDEERQLAKEQAQRDFDRMVEAERKGQGGDGFSSKGGGGGWGSVWGGKPSGRGGL